MARKFKRITDPNIATKSLATCNEKYRRNILSCMQQAMYYTHLRLSAVLQKLIPEAEVSHLIDILVQQSDTLTNVTRKIIKYDLCVNVRTLFAIRNLFNIKDKDTEILDIIGKLNNIEVRHLIDIMIPVRHLLPDGSKIVNSIPTRTAAGRYRVADRTKNKKVPNAEDILKA